MRLTLDPRSMADYRTFLKVKRLPRYSIDGETVEFPDEYSATLGLPAWTESAFDYRPLPSLFDY